MRLAVHGILQSDTTEFPPPWTPLDLNPVIWLDASQLGLANGASVATFPDLSGNGNDFVQANATQQPAFRTSGINGIGSVEGDGVNDTMLLSSVAAAATWWQITVIQLVAFAGSTVNAYSVDDFTPDGNYFLLQITGVNNFNVVANAGAFGGSPMGVGVPKAYLCRGSATTASILPDTGSPFSNAGNYSKAIGAMRLFARGDGFPANCLIGELIYGTGTLTTPQQTAIWTYLGAKWGTSLNNIP